MISDHEAIEELLAGYVLRSLTGEDAAAADRLLSEHVPTCSSCRKTLSEFRDVAADLALNVDPISPPEMLLPRLHKELGMPSGRRRGPMTSFAVAAGFIVVVGMAGVAVTQGIRASNAQSRADLFSQVADMQNKPTSKKVQLTSGTQATSAPMNEISAPGETRVYLYGTDIPEPSPGMVYRVWIGKAGSFDLAAQFVPDDERRVVVALEIDPEVDQILITEDPAGSTPLAPAAEDVRWSTAA